MSVYVDDMAASYGRMVMCHMIADTHEELQEMAYAIGLDGKWLQSAGTYREHYDVCKSKRSLAIERGAIPVTMLEIGRKLRARRTVPGAASTPAEREK